MRDGDIEMSFRKLLTGIFALAMLAPFSIIGVSAQEDDLVRQQARVHEQLQQVEREMELRLAELVHQRVEINQRMEGLNDDEDEREKIMLIDLRKAVDEEKKELQREYNAVHMRAKQMKNEFAREREERSRAERERVARDREMLERERIERRNQEREREFSGAQELRNKIRHLMSAFEHLREADMDDMAQRVRQHAERLEQELHNAELEERAAMEEERESAESVREERLPGQRQRAQNQRQRENQESNRQQRDPARADRDRAEQDDGFRREISVALRELNAAIRALRQDVDELKRKRD
jgi:hypothetical protein